MRRWRRSSAAREELALAITRAACLIVLTSATLQVAQGQEFRVLHYFSGPDGAVPLGVLTLDNEGNLYGTTQFGGLINQNCNINLGCGTVFKLARAGSDWELSSLHKFLGQSDGAAPTAGVVFGQDGDLYGTTPWAYVAPPTFNDRGTVYKLSPGDCEISCAWIHTVLHRFQTFQGGDNPSSGSLVFDREGNMYGTTMEGGPDCTGGQPCGIVYELTPSGDSWTYQIVYSFTGGADGDEPIGGVVLDAQGNLYGVTEYGGTGQSGNAYEVSPSSSGWIENTIYSFGMLGYPSAGLAIDSQAHLYGVAGNVAFDLIRLSSGWILNPLYSFGGDYLVINGPLAMDSAGNLYGTTWNGGLGGGNVFKLAPGTGGWTYTDLHDFHGPDGAMPFSGVTLDTDGNLYGTTAFGGHVSCNPPTGCGVVWEVTP